MAIKDILVLGSIAYDYIMDFNGDFNDNLSANKEKKIFNIAVMPTSKYVNFGGTSGNISYNLAQLDAQVKIITAVGKDFIDLGYQNHLKKLSSLEFIGDIHNDLFTASAYIVNDINHNQMIIFHQGAMIKCPEISLSGKKISKENIKLASVSPDNYGAMISWARELNSLGIKYILDPGQVTPAFTKEILEELVPKAYLLIGNEYEIKMIQDKMNIDLKGLLNRNPNIIITLGERGSICYENKIKHEIKCSKAEKVLDTTGAGDGYRAGLLYGLVNDLPLITACQIGSVTSSFVVESIGPQTQCYDITKMKKRYKENFNEELKC